AIARGGEPEAAYEAALAWARSSAVAPVTEALVRAASEAPRCDEGHVGWVLIMLQNAFHELLHAPTVEAGVVATVRRGGDTDTNGAVAGRGAAPADRPGRAAPLGGGELSGHRLPPPRRPPRPPRRSRPGGGPPAGRPPAVGLP